jgi:hypothetical protein
MAANTERDLPTTLATVASLRWSPDNEWLLASGSDGRGRSGLFRVRVRDGTVRPEVIAETAGPTGIPGDWTAGGAVVSDPDATAVAQRGDITARASATVVKAAGREWPVSNAAWLAWKQDRLLAGAGRQAFLLTTEGVTPLPWENYDGGPFSVHPDGKTIAYTTGETRSAVFVLEHILAPNPARDELDRSADR